MGDYNPSAEAEERLIQKAISIVREEKKASIQTMQQRLHLSYVRAAEVIEFLIQRRVVRRNADGSLRESTL